MKYEVTVRWTCEARIEVEADSEDAAEVSVRDEGLPWDVAQEADDGQGYSIDVEVAL